MDPVALLDEVTIMKRILYKEKPDLKSLTQKCLEFEKLDYGKLNPIQKDEVLSGLYEDLNSLEQMTEKQGVLFEFYSKEYFFQENRQETLKNEVKQCSDEILELRKELELEKYQRANLLEYEGYAKHINTLPRCEEIVENIKKIEEDYEDINKKIEEKKELLAKVEKMSKEIIDGINYLIEGHSNN